MRKLFVLLAAVIALAFTACNQNEPEKNDFEIIVSNVTSTSADYQIVPHDLEATYVIMFFNADISSNTDDQVRADIKNAFDVLIKNLPNITGYDFFLKTGIHEGHEADLNPGSITTLVATKMDAEGHFSGQLCRKPIHTQK